jgi:ABC-type uncharacterized transport system auxiliary subunit
MRRLRRLLIALLPALPGCSGLLHSTAPALQLYVLAPPEVAAAPHGSGPTLRIARPLSGPALNTDRIALLRSGHRLDYYAGSRWSAPLPELISDLELTVLRNDPAWSAVADDRSTFNADYLLQTSIDRFTAEYASESEPPDIRVELHCLLIRRSDGILVGSFAITEQAVAKENRMSSVVASFAAVADRAIIELQKQTDQLVRSAKFPTTP